jgi:hypothetical protein
MNRTYTYSMRSIFCKMIRKFWLAFPVNYILQPLQLEKFDVFVHNAEVKTFR